MKNLILLLSGMICYITYTQSKTLSGNWRELQRLDLNGNAINFDDTIYMAFRTGGEYTWQKKRSFIYRGTYKINDKKLDLGARWFSVLKHTDNKLVLKDEGATYEFERYTPAANAKLPAEKMPSAVTDMNEISGKWNVFKRTSDQVMKDIDYAVLVEDVVIDNKDGAWGYITSSASPHQKDGWKITSLSDGMLHAEGKTSRQFEVSRRGNELILKEGSITYFLKEFKE